MINFNNRYFSLLVWGVTLYLFYKYSGGFIGLGNQVKGDQLSAADAVLSIDIDPNKNYKDYTILQKIIYYFYSDKLDAEIAKYQERKNRIKMLPVREGAMITLSYQVGISESYTEQVKVTKDMTLTLLPNKRIYEDIVGLYQGDSKNIGNGNNVIQINILSVSQ